MDITSIPAQYTYCIYLGELLTPVRVKAWAVEACNGVLSLYDNNHHVTAMFASGDWVYAVRKEDAD